MIRNRGATLLELLVSVAIVAALAAISITVLRQVFRSERDLRDLSNMRQSMIDFAAWAGDHNDAFVNAGLPGDPGASWYYGEESSLVAQVNMYPSQAFQWLRVLQRWGGEASLVWHSVHGVAPTGRPPHTQEEFEANSHWYPTRFNYSLTLLTDPNCWTFSGAGFTSNEEFSKHYAMVRMSQVAHPSQKGVLAIRPPHPGAGDLYLVAFADGAATAKRPSEAAETAAYPTGPVDLRAPPVFSTLRGYLGVDF